MDYPKYYCVFYGRRDRFEYKYSYEDIKKEYPFIQMHGRMDEALASDMGNEFFIARFEFLEDLNKFKDMVSKKKDE
jgi:hypothetical protein